MGRGRDLSGGVYYLSTIIFRGREGAEGTASPHFSIQKVIHRFIHRARVGPRLWATKDRPEVIKTERAGTVLPLQISPLK